MLPANQTIWTLFEHSQTQLIYSFGGVAGIQYLAVQWVADKLNITLDANLFMKLRIIENEMLTLVNEKTPDKKPVTRDDEDS